MHGVGPLLSAGRVVGDLDPDPDLVRRFGLFCRDVHDHTGPDDSDVSYMFNMYILEAVDDPTSVRAPGGSIRSWSTWCTPAIPAVGSRTTERAVRSNLI